MLQVHQYSPPVYCIFLLSKPGGYDLYIDGDGKWEIETKAIDCPTISGPDGEITFRFVEKNLWSFKLQARNHKYVDS